MSHPGLRSVNLIAILALVLVLAGGGCRRRAGSSGAATETGSPVWIKSYGSADHQYYSAIHDVAATADGDFLLAGDRAHSDGRTGWLTRVDMFGNPLWARDLGQTADVIGMTRVRDAIRTLDGGWAIAGGRPENTDVLLRLDSQGNVLWERGPSEGIVTIERLRRVSSGVIVVGVRSQENGSHRPWMALVEADTDGRVIWERQYELDTEDVYVLTTSLRDVGECADGRLVAVGARGALLETRSGGDLLTFRQLEHDGAIVSELGAIDRFPGGGFAIAGSGARLEHLFLIGDDLTIGASLVVQPVDIHLGSQSKEVLVLGDDTVVALFAHGLLCRWDGTTLVFHREVAEGGVYSRLSPTGIASLDGDPDGRLLVAVNRHLVEVDLTTGQPAGTGDVELEREVRSLVPIDDDGDRIGDRTLVLFRDQDDGGGGYLVREHDGSFVDEIDLGANVTLSLRAVVEVGDDVVVGGWWREARGKEWGFVARVSGDGTTVRWQRSFRLAEGSTEVHALATAGDGVIIGGQCEDVAWLAFLDDTGATLWQRRFGDPVEGDVTSIVPDPEGDGWYLGGILNVDAFLARITTSGEPHPDWDFPLRIYDATPDVDRDSTKPRGSTDDVRIAAHAGGQVTLLVRRDDTYGSYVPVHDLLRVGAGGGVLWSQRFLTAQDDSSQGWWKRTRDGGMVPRADGGVVVAVNTSELGGGFLDSYGVKRTNVWLRAFHPDGTICWERVYGTAEQDYVTALATTNSGGLIAGGGTLGFFTSAAGLAIRVDPQGRLHEGCAADFTPEEFPQRSVAADHPTMLEEAAPTPLEVPGTTNESFPTRVFTEDVAAACRGASTLQDPCPHDGIEPPEEEEEEEEKTPPPPAAGSILFASDRDGDFELYTVEPDGSNLVKITDNDARDLDPVWSPDRTRIAFLSNRDGQPGGNDLYVMTVATGAVVRRTFIADDAGDVRDPGWSPDGTRIACVTIASFATAGIVAGSPDSGAFSILTPPGLGDRWPTWSPDGSQIAFTRDGTILVLDPNLDGTQTPEVLLDRASVDEAPHFGPDGRIVFVARGPGATGIQILDPSTSAVVELTVSGDDAAPTFSPNGAEVLFVRDAGDGPRLFRIPAAGGTAVEVEAGATGTSDDPDWR